VCAAVLATLAILVWHLYSVASAQMAYPMNPAWLKGMFSDEEMREER
jgi:hypothetical protein